MREIRRLPEAVLVTEHAAFARPGFTGQESLGHGAAQESLGHGAAHESSGFGGTWPGGRCRRPGAESQAAFRVHRRETGTQMCT